MDGAFNCGIYAIKNTINGRMYVGQSSNLKKRLNNHRRLLMLGRHHCARLQRAWVRYGPQSFSFTIVLFCSANNLTMYEQLAIDTSGDTYNTALCADAPTRGVSPTAATRAKLSAAQRNAWVNGRPKARPPTSESRLRMSCAQKKRFSTLESRAKMAATQKERWRDKALRAKVSTAVKVALALKKTG